MRVLTRKQRDLHTFLCVYLETVGCSPSYKDILDGTKIKDQGLVLFALRRRGLLDFKKNDGTIMVTWVLAPGGQKLQTEQFARDPYTNELLTPEDIEQRANWQERRCLCCQAVFTSKHKFNRLCEACNAEAACSSEYGLGYISNGAAISVGMIGGKFLDGRV
jgi:hypothetical protein